MESVLAENPDGPNHMLNESAENKGELFPEGDVVLSPQE
jgi:hypothetical protein